MAQLTTFKNGKGSRLKPRPQTIKFLLDYSKSLGIVELSNGEKIGLIKN